MKNPLRKRLPRELKTDAGKYIVIFLFMVMLISLVSAFLVVDLSFTASYNEGFTKYNIEDGHLAFNREPDASLLQELEQKGNVKLYDLRYFEESISANNATIRVYKDRETVNTECLMSGELPDKDNEIALDRMFANNANLSVGDVIAVNGHNLTICGLIAVPDYSCLFENNADMMFDAVHFGVGVMTTGGFDAVESCHVTANYAWKYPKTPADEVEEKEWSDAFLEVLGDVVEEYDTNLVEAQMEDILIYGLDETNLIKPIDYLPRYSNKAINFTGEDMGSDMIMFLIFSYIVIAILAFVFAVTINNTITQEAGVIGTLRASGFTKGELVRHYMALPVAVTFLAAIIGNVLGYTVLKQVMVDMYMGSYSFATYTTLWSTDAFLLTTVVPIVMMFVINLLVLLQKMKLTPLQFLRHELNKRSKKKAFRLNTKIPFLHRFRLRILFQNIPAYLTLFLGIFVGMVVAVFGLMFVPLFDDYAKLVEESRISNYQYVLKDMAETEVAGAEKYCVTSLESMDEGYMTDDVMIYGIHENSNYVKAEIHSGEVLVSNGMAAKFGYAVGDSFTLKDPYSDRVYTFRVGGIYRYDAAIAIFMNRGDYITTFGEESDYFTGYFSNDKLIDLDENQIASLITEEDLTKLATQMKISMGGFMKLMAVFAMLMFLLLMYLLTKQIIEKNTQSISMTKILGFTNGEIGGLYLVITSVVVVLSLLLSVPLVHYSLKWIFLNVLYQRISGYFPFQVSVICYVKAVAIGLVSFVVSCILLMMKIHRISMSDALKNVE